MMQWKIISLLFELIVQFQTLHLVHFINDNKYFHYSLLQIKMVLSCNLHSSDFYQTLASCTVELAIMHTIEIDAWSMQEMT